MYGRSWSWVVSGPVPSTSPERVFGEALDPEWWIERGVEGVGTPKEGPGLVRSQCSPKPTRYPCTFSEGFWWSVNN